MSRAPISIELFDFFTLCSVVSIHDLMTLGLLLLEGSHLMSNQTDGGRVLRGTCSSRTVAVVQK